MSRVQILITLLLAAMLGLVPMIAQGQDTTPPKPCQEPEASQFDFWVGEWNLTWPDTSKPNDVATGTNIITKELGGCVIEENFTTHDEPLFIGNSVSVYATKIKKWQQTWVDNTGNYLDFVGGWEGDRMILSRETTDREGKPLMQRMVWHNIADDGFDWNWERSKDGGKTWELSWAIHYERKR